MRHYESIFLFKATLNEEETKAKISKYVDFLTSSDAKIEKHDDMGIRTLAYTVEKHKRGYYYVMYFTIDNHEIIKELERMYKIDEDVLKYMTLAFKTKKEISAWKNLVAGKIQEPKVTQRKPREDTRGGYRQDKSNRNDRYQRNKEEKPKVETKLEADAKPSNSEKSE